MSCRLSTISFENGENVETYIKNALVEEFKSAGMYSQTSKKRLVGNIRQFIEKLLLLNRALLRSSNPTFDKFFYCGIS